MSTVRDYRRVSHASPSSPRRPPAPSASATRGRHSTTGFWPAARAAQFVLRIEDTDRERSTPENVDLIFESMDWLGIDFDEGPVFQSANAERHAAVVAGAAGFRPRVPDDGRPEQVKAYKAANDNRGFRGVEESEGAIRLRMPDEGVTTVNDIIRGETAFENALLDDLVIARADGTPVYHLAVVVDDSDAQITHVVRGADHYSNTPKHLRIYEAFGATPPTTRIFRSSTVRMGRSFRSAMARLRCQISAKTGYLREAVINYLALLGWGYDETTTFLTIEELQQLFSLERVSKNPGRLRRAEVALDQRPLHARVERRRPDGAPGGVHRARGPEARAWRSRRRRSRPSPSSGRWQARSYDGPTDDP